MKIVMLDGETLPVPLTVPPGWRDWQVRGHTAESDIVTALQDATVAITNNKVPLRAATLEQLPALRFICVAATGYDYIDFAACRARGIVVSNVLGYSTQSVSEGDCGYLCPASPVTGLHPPVRAQPGLMCNIFVCIVSRFRILAARRWLGIVGKGDIGQAVGKLAQALGMKVRYAERKGSATLRDGYVSFEQMLATSDIISLHCPLSEQTRQMIDRDALDKMKPQSLLINEADLAIALQQGQIGGATLDVLSSEPPAADNPLLQSGLTNLLLTPHIAWASQSGVHNLLQGITANLVAFSQGQPINVVS